MNRELCLPQVWSADRERRREAGVPQDVCFQTMAQLAQRMMERGADEDVSAGQDDGNTRGTRRSGQTMPGPCRCFWIGVPT